MHWHTKVVRSAGDAATYMQLVGRSNECTKLIKAGKLKEAEALLRGVLASKPAAGFDEVSIALTQNELGGVLRQLGELDEALELLMKALEVRDHADEESGITIALRDGNFTREEIGKVYEAKGDCSKALEVRQPDKRICGNEACEALDYEVGKLQACSRCKCVFYCGKTCQRHDWKNRHKPLCQPEKAAKAS
ncbi:hypothetical protein L916_21536 [Phytophthora nicotianae]|uniref:phytol kinase n=2 Tax=Phytophthora nicotianae TaxID=4792 RepID=W2HTA6_PHYNI|nr:hypothetical protein L916_21536 [Phytophthora nicotianae]ETO59356.1 hypothetical protein F444_22264 [Phytophthora nicotianae P1976]